MRPVSVSLLVLSLVVAACSGVAPRAGQPEPEFFRLPLVTPDGRTAEVRPDAPEPSGAPAAPGYRMDFQVRWTASDLPHFYTPSLSVFAGQRGSVSLINQVSFVQDFDVEIEVQQGVFIADPIIGILQSGLVLEALPRAVKGTDAIAFSWSVLMSEAEPPFRVKEVEIGVGEPVTIQLPSIQVTRASGRTLVAPGEHTLLAEVPFGEGTLEVAVRVTPDLLGGDPNTTFLLGPDARITEPEQLIDDLGVRPPPTHGGFLDVAVVSLRSALPSRRMHLDRASAERTLGDLVLKPIREFRIRAASEAGAKVSCLLNKSYMKDYEVQVSTEVAAPFDPIVGTVELGLDAECVEGENGPELEYKLVSLVGFTEFTSDTGGSGPLTIELPEVVVSAGSLELRSAVNVIEIGKLTSGERLALVVRRGE